MILKCNCDGKPDIDIKTGKMNGKGETELFIFCQICKCMMLKAFKRSI